MALHFTLKVNAATIGWFEAVRTDAGFAGTTPDDLNEYMVEISQSNGVSWRGVVEHRYGDGPWTLVRKSIQLMEEAA